MAISSISSLSNFDVVAAASNPAQRSASTPTQAQVATPDVVVTLGANASSTPLYNAAGLLRSLQQLQAANALPSTPDPNSAEAQLLANLNNVLGLNTSTAGGEIFNTTGSLSNFSADAMQALNNVLNSGVDGTGVDRNQILSDLLSQAMNFSSTGLDGTTATASVLDATGILQNVSSGTTTGTLNNLLGAELGLAATALNLNTSSATSLASNGLLQSSASGSTDAFGSLLSADVALAAARIGNQASGQGNSGNGGDQTLTDVLLSNLNLSSAAGGVVKGSTSSANATTASATTQSLSAQAFTSAVVALPITTGLSNTASTSSTNSPAATVAGQTQTATIQDKTNSTPATVSVPTAESGTATTGNSATARLQTLLSDPAARAAISITDPGYAAAAAALYLSAAIFRFHSSGEIDLESLRAGTPNTIQGIHNVSALKAV